MAGFAYGADLSWASQMEQKGVFWVNGNGEKTDILQASRALGVDSVRLRVFVHPPKDSYVRISENEGCMLGLCDERGVLDMALRVQNAGLRLMLDFHYSDTFADPQHQILPAAWSDDDENKLCERIRVHTKEVLGRLKAKGIHPEWVQVGNEVNNGFLWPAGVWPEQSANFVKFFNSGAAAVKELLPEAKVILHLAMMNSVEQNRAFLDSFFKKGGKVDILGFSLYPYWAERMQDPVEWPLTEYFQAYSIYKKEIMITEIGEEESNPERSYELLLEAIHASRQVQQEDAGGVFYWEPEAVACLLPDHYPLGASVYLGENRVQYTKALAAFRDSRMENLKGK